MNAQGELLSTLTAFQELSIGLATGESVGYENWEEARARILQMPQLLAYLPEWVSANRWGGQFWQFIKAESSTYAGRRQLIWSSLSPAFEFAEKGATQPTGASLDPLLASCSSKSVSELWERIHQRIHDDPEGAITAARAMLEAVCKYILESLGIQYSEKSDLPALYKQTADAMQLSPAQHSEKAFKKILQGCTSVVGGLAELRNKLGDAHGKSGMAAKPAARHAHLAANMAGTMSAFLIATYEAKWKVNS